MWGRHKGEMATTLANKIKYVGYTSKPNDANEMWISIAETIRRVAKETLWVFTGKPKVHKESWWWNEEVQRKIKEKKKRFKELMAYTVEEDRIHKKESYKEAKCTAKKAVVEAKSRAYADFYQKLDTKEGEKHIFKLAKARSMQRQNLGSMKYIKDEGKRVLFKQEDIKMRWHQHFSQLLNETRGVKEEGRKAFEIKRTLDHGSISDITT
ncbi:uncharacterized protein LOC130821493 [Amaranthus tricolor]|uniref:uncharacterized protein LOC130821493 n=1 Tax=Amaranthus tricolor TaxID=29722 RepID=UPI00258806D2|nr:uncharacterized protein LOC130821493 [Amaranthus tricolor]